MRKEITRPNGRGYDETVVIKSDGKTRELRSLAELDRAIAEENFAYVEASADNPEAYRPRFFQFRGSWYDVNDGFNRVTDPIYSGWDGIQSQSYFDAVLIRYPFEWDGITVDYDSVVVGYTHW